MSWRRAGCAAQMACLLGLAPLAPAQTPSPAPACVSATEMSHLQLYGLWRAEFSSGAQAALLFERHPDYPESLSGAITRDGVQARVVGDVDNGVFTLEESLDGQSISALWQGQVKDGSCGKEITGSWKTSDSTNELGFILRKVPGWQ